MKRRLDFKGKQYEVLKHRSSGLGDQFTVDWTNAEGKQQFLYLSTAEILKQPEHLDLFDACRSVFTLEPTLGNNIRLNGSFYQPKE